MNFTLAASPLARVIDAIKETTPVEWLLDLAVGVGGIFLGWFIATATCARIKPSPRWTFGKGDFRRVAVPLFAVVLVWIGKHVLAQFQEVAILEILESILVAYTAIRVAVYILGHVIPEGGFHRLVIRTVYGAALIGVALYVTGLLPDVLSWLDGHGFQFGKDRREVTLLDVAKGIVAIFSAVVLALWLSRITETRVMAAESMEATTRLVITKVLRIVIVTLAFLIVLPLAGIDVTTISIFSGAVGVGLGFGLQKIASNYVSGFIVLLDRSLRIGDVVTVDNKRGEVVAIESRYTVVKGGDGIESIIPNEKMITEIVQHHTYSDPKVAVVVGVTIAYESDYERACELLLDAAKQQGRVVGEPPATARVKQLTDRGIELEATVWISDPARGEADLRSELLKEILGSFRAAGIEIPYPRREIRSIATAETEDFRGASRA